MAAAAPAAPPEATLTCRMPCGAAKLASALATSLTAAPPATGLSHRCTDCVCKILHKRLAAFVAEPTHWVRSQCPQRRGGRAPERMPAKVRLICLCVCVCVFVCVFASGARARLFDRRGLPWNASRTALADDEARPEYPAVPQLYASLQTAQCAACAAGSEIKSIGFKSI